MTDIPLPAPGDNDWSDWGAEQEELSDAAREIVSGRLTAAALATQNGPQSRPFGVGNIHGPGDVSYNGATEFTNGTFRGPAQRVLRGGVTYVRFLFTNYGPDSVAGPAAITIGCTIEQPGSVFTPLTFGGRLTTVIDPRGRIWSDWAALDLAVGWFWPRTWIDVGSVAVGFRSTFACSPALGEGGSYANGTTTDLRNSGTIPTLPSYPGYGPVQAEGRAAGTRLPVIGITGDSIVTGTGEAGGGEAVTTAQGYPNSGTLYRTYYRGGWPYRGINERLPIVHVSKGGLTAQLAVRYPQSRGEFALCDHVICGFGTNDFQASTVAQVQGYWLTIWNSIGAVGPKVWQSTLMPVTTSTDSWATTTNQTPTAGEAKRTQLNDWLRAGAPIDPTTLAAVAIGTSGALLAGSAGHPLAGYFETADLVESARNSGKWKASHTSDGTHPNPTGAAAAAAVLGDLSVFALTGLTQPPYPTPVIPPATNMLSTNTAGAETNTSGFEVHGQCTISRDTTVFRSGVASYKMTATGTDSAMRTLLASKISPLTAGVSYTASAWVRDATTLRGTRIDIWWYDAGGTLISAANGTPVTPSALNTWTQIAVTGTAPTNTTQGIIVITNQASANAEIFNVDDVFIG